MGKRREDTKGSENKVQRPGGCRGLQANTPLGDFRELVWEWLLGILAVWKPLESSSFLQLPRKSALAKQLWGQLGLSVLSPSACRKCRQAGDGGVGSEHSGRDRPREGAMGLKTVG